MNWKWYILVLVSALLFFGAAGERTTIPTQEIVVQFDALTVNADDVELAVAEITDQLKAIGVTEIHVSELRKGKLRVAYYSTIDIAVVKNLFYKQNKLQLDGTAFNTKEGSSKIPFHSNSNSYKLDVIQIQKDFGPDPGLQGLPVIVKSAKDQYLKPILSIGSAEIIVNLRPYDERTGFKDYRNFALSKDGASHKFPEVRAGPLS